MTVSRQSGGSSDDNENFLDLSGVTIESPDTYAEAGLAFFNTSGRLANSRIGTIKSEGGPYTYGLLMTNSLQGAEAGIRREVTIDKSIVNGTVLFDDARGADGAATTTVRSGIKAYGNVVGSRVVGGVGYTYGQRGSITGSEITGAVVLTDAETGPDPSNPLVRAFSATGSSLLGGLTNTGTTAALVAGNFWGTSTTTGPVETGTVLSEAPAPLSVPAATLDAPPTGAIVDPYGPTTVAWDETIYPVVVAADDFGVKSVELTANGLPVATVGRTPYEFEYRPAYEHIGDHVVLSAKITDSSGQATVVSTELDVPAVTTSTNGTVTGSVPATLVPERRRSRRVRRLHRRCGEGLRRLLERDRPVDRRRRGPQRHGPERDRARPPRQRHLRAAPAAVRPGAERRQHRQHVRHHLRHAAHAADLRRARQQRRGHARVQAADRRQRRAADRHLLQDPDLHAVNDDTVRAARRWLLLETSSHRRPDQSLGYG